MISQLGDRLSSLEAFLVEAPLPHFHKIDEAIRCWSSLSSQQGAAVISPQTASKYEPVPDLNSSQIATVADIVDHKPSLVEPDVEKSPERCVTFDLFDLSGTSDVGS